MIHVDVGIGATFGFVIAGLRQAVVTQVLLLVQISQRLLLGIVLHDLLFQVPRLRQIHQLLLAAFVFDLLEHVEDVKGLFDSRERAGGVPILVVLVQHHRIQNIVQGGKNVVHIFVVNQFCVQALDDIGGLRHLVSHLLVDVHLNLHLLLQLLNFFQVFVAGWALAERLYQPRDLGIQGLDVLLINLLLLLLLVLHITEKFLLLIQRVHHLVIVHALEVVLR